MENGFSLSDISAVMGRDGFENGSWILIILFVLILGNNGFGRVGDYGQFATSASQQEILFGQQFQNIDNKIDRIGNGIADLGYALTNNIHNAQDVVAGAVVNEGRNTQGMISDVRYDMANFACAINSNIDSKFAQLEKNQMQSQIDAQAREINQLYIAQQMCGVVRYPNGMMYNAGTSPFCNCGNGCCN